jgi:hypothetical protein
LAGRERDRNNGGHHEGDRGGGEHEASDRHLHPQVQCQEDPSQHHPDMSGAKSGGQAAEIGSHSTFGNTTTNI